ncbi:hypothetical protein [Halomonas sp. S2151]|uniref:hypothetical protein n=1 Tax=Halomonas sp. S2151 TaxID=579478 RepID=UPI000ABCF79A|nr:hypothetical protein [Halomonas sp. S2151]
MPRGKRKADRGTPALKNSVYAVKGARNTRSGMKAVFRGNAKQTKQAKDAIARGQQMAKIEAYAREHKITIAQAMIHFM